MKIIREVEDLLGDLPNLHTQLDKPFDRFKVGADSITPFHKAFYDKYRAGWPEMEKAYLDLVKSLGFDRPLYQSFPTFRVHLPGNVAVGDYHTDFEYNHPEGELNYVLALTDMFDTNSIFIESAPGRGDFSPMKLKKGELMFFNGNKLRHGNELNQTGVTRVSIDFRILPREKYEESDRMSKTTNTKFKIGGYYKQW